LTKALLDKGWGTLVIDSRKPDDERAEWAELNVRNARNLAELCRPGDLIAQVHRLEFADEVAARTSPIRLGVYDPDSGQRLSVTSGGRAADFATLR
jgi:hypothetical protein